MAITTNSPRGNSRPPSISARRPIVSDAEPRRLQRMAGVAESPLAATGGADSREGHIKTPHSLPGVELMSASAELGSRSMARSPNEITPTT